MPAFIAPLMFGLALGGGVGATLQREPPTLVSKGQTTEISNTILVAGLLVSVSLAAIVLLGKR